MATGVLSVFDVRAWFSKKKGELSRDIPAREGRQIMVSSEYPYYIIILPGFNQLILDAFVQKNHLIHEAQLLT